MVGHREIDHELTFQWEFCLSKFIGLLSIGGHTQGLNMFDLRSNLRFQISSLLETLRCAYLSDVRRKIQNKKHYRK